MNTTTVANTLMAAIFLCACSEAVHLGQSDFSDSGTGGVGDTDVQTGGMGNQREGTGGMGNSGEGTGGMGNQGAGPSVPGVDRFSAFTLTTKGPCTMAKSSTLSLDSSTRRLSWNYCVPGNHGRQYVHEAYRILSDAELTQIRASLAQVVVGSQPSCTQDGSFLNLDLEIDGAVTGYTADNDSSCVARPLGKTYVMNLSQFWSTVYDLSTRPALSSAFDQLAYTNLAGPDEAAAGCGSAIESLLVNATNQQIRWDECLRQSSSSGLTGVSTRRTGSRQLSNGEMDLVRTGLESVQVLNLDFDCTGLRNLNETLELAIGGVTTTYFNAYNCPRPQGDVPLATLGLLPSFIEPLARPVQMPSNFDQLVLSTDTAKDADVPCGENQRGYVVDWATKQFSTARCEAMGGLVKSTTRVLADPEFAKVQAALAQVTVGVNGVCDTTRSRTTLDLLGPEGSTYAQSPFAQDADSSWTTVLASRYVNDADSCEAPDRDARTYVMHLDALEAVLSGLAP